MKQKFLALTLCVVMGLSFSACQGDNSSSSESKVSYPLINNQATFWNSDGNISFKGYSNNIELGTPEKSQTAADILKNFRYSESILYGSFTNAEAEKNAKSNQSTVSYTNYDGKYPSLCNLEKSEEMTVLPYRIEAGFANVSEFMANDFSHEWMKVYYLKKSTSNSGSIRNDYLSLMCAYEIKDNKKLLLYPVKKQDKETDASGNYNVKYWLYTTPIEYDFSYEGTRLVLSKDGEEIQLDSTLNLQLNPEIQADASVSQGSDKIDEIEEINLSAHTTNSSHNISLKVNDKNNETAIAQYNKDGLFTMTYIRTKDDDTQEITTHQYVLFYQDKHGLVLTDGEKTYYYQSTSYTRNDDTSNYSFDEASKYSFMDMTKFISDDDKSKTVTLSETKMDNIAEKNNSLTDDLAKAFKDEGLTVIVDKATGEMRLDANVVFGGDSAELSDEGKSVIQKTMKAYTKTINNEKYKGFVNTTYIEGHTAPIAGSTYESGMSLSEERAENVKKYILSKECGIDSAYLPDLEKSLISIGYSNSRPVKDAVGNIDLDASRRVSIHYVINLDSVS